MTTASPLMDAAPGQLRHRALLLLFLALPVGCLSPNFSMADSKFGAITIHFVDFGIDQPWSTADEIGAHFGPGISPHADLFRGDASTQLVRLLVPMPTDEELDTISPNDLRQRIADKLGQEMGQALAAGKTQFEVQFIEHIDLLGYAGGSPHSELPAPGARNRQDLVALFGAAAYGALSDVVHRLAPNTERLVLFGTLGSNGTAMFAHSVEAWRNVADYIGQVTLVDGRAKMIDVLQSIIWLGDAKVRIVVNHHDAWAPLDSIANLSVAQSVQRTYPGVTLLVAEQEKAGWSWLANHISTMSQPDAVFHVVQKFATGPDNDLGEVTGREIHPLLSARELVNLGATLPPIRHRAIFGVGLSERPGSQSKPATENGYLSHDALEQMAEVFKSAGELLKQTADSANKLGDAGLINSRQIHWPLLRVDGKIVEVGSNIYEAIDHFDRLYEAVRIDLKDTSSRSVPISALHLTDELGRFGLWITDLVMTDGAVKFLRGQEWNAARVAPAASAVLAIGDDFTTAVADIVGRGKPTDADVVLLAGSTVKLGFWAVGFAIGSELGSPVAGSIVGQAFAGMAGAITKPFLQEIAVLARGDASHPLPTRDQQLAQAYNIVVQAGQKNGNTPPSMESFYSATPPQITLTQRTEERYRETCNAGICIRHYWSSPKGDASLIGSLSPTGCNSGGSGRTCDPAGFAQGNSLPPGPPRPSLPPASASTGKSPNPPVLGDLGSSQRDRQAQIASLSPSSDPARRDFTPLGGIDLRVKTLLACGPMPKIRGVFIDPQTKTVILAGDPDASAGLDVRDLALAIWLVFEKQEVKFSLDPADRLHPDGKWLKAVYIPRLLMGRTFGYWLYKADFLLKQYSFGVAVDEHSKIERRRSIIPAYQSYADLLFEDSPENATPQWSRDWFVVDYLNLKQGTGGAILFNLGMSVKARRQVPDSSTETGLRDFDTDTDSLEQRWARQFSANLGEFAKEAPAFARLEEMAKAIGLAKWLLKQQDVPVDLEAIRRLVNKDRVQTVDKVTALSVEWQKDKRQPFATARGHGEQITSQHIHLFGGVDLTVNPKVVPDDGAARDFSESVSRVLRTLNVAAGTPFTVIYRGERLQAIALPLLSDVPLPSANRP